MLPRDFEALYIGYRRRIQHQSNERRHATYINILPHVKDLPFDKFCRNFWPLETDVPVKKIDTNVSHETFRQIMKTHQNKNK